MTPRRWALIIAALVVLFVINEVRLFGWWH